MNNLNFWLSCIHAGITSVTAFFTMILGWDPRYTIAISLVYFSMMAIFEESVEFAMIVHHVLAFGTGVLFMFWPKYAIVYVWMQFGEISTIPLNIWKRYKYFWACVAFGLLFLFGRVVFQGVMFFPFIYNNWVWQAFDLTLAAIGLTFYSLQCYWLIRIAKMCRTMLYGKKHE